MLFDSRFWRQRLILVKNLHGGILVHVVVLVEVFLQFVVSAEGPLESFHRANETENLILNHASFALAERNAEEVE